MRTSSTFSVEMAALNCADVARSAAFATIFHTPSASASPPAPAAAAARAGPARKGRRRHNPTASTNSAAGMSA